MAQLLVLVAFRAEGHLWTFLGGVSACGGVGARGGDGAGGGKDAAFCPGNMM